MNKTKQYIIKITATDKEHAEAKKRIEVLFRQLNRDLEADMELYVQPITENHKRWGNVPYNLENKKYLHFVK